MKETRYSLFIRNVVQDALLFVFLLMVLSVFRGIFIWIFADTLIPGTSFNEIGLTLWYGLRLSLKTAGACVLPVFVCATLVQAGWTNWPAEKIRFGWACFVLLLLSLLFQTRIPYYQEFHHAFSPFIFNTFNDDVGAIVSTSIDQYHAVWRTLVGLGCTAVLIILLRGCFSRLTPWIAKPLWQVRRRSMVVTLFVCCLVPLFVFIRFGGSFTFNGSIYWKNAARLNQHLLNEAVLDDIQSLYKASRLYKKLRKSAVSVRAEDVRLAAARLMGQTHYTADTLRPLLERKAKQFLGKKPTHIFVIVAETYMMWPLLEEYQAYPIANGVRRLLTRPDSVLVKNFLPASNGTMFGVTSVLLGIPELNLQASNRPTALEPYETALSVQLRKQGYRTRFFYGGFPSWENIGPFMQHQQFDQSFYAADFGGQGGVWGVADREFLQGIEQKITKDPSLNFILTSSNHPPYKVNTEPENELPRIEQLESLLPAQTADKPLVAARMWHFAYADKYLAEFVEKMISKYPNSLFVITGDHADRWTLKNSPTDYERTAVPLILIAPSLRSKKVNPQYAASHMDVAATVLDLVLPPGTPYQALGTSIFTPAADKIPVGIAAYSWITPYELGRLNEEKAERLPQSDRSLSAQERQQVLQRVQDIQTVTAWRILKGVELPQ